jgi:hypothetical protein
MKRLLVLAALVAAIVVVNVQPATSAGDTRGPACANITNGSVLYSEEGVISADVFLAAPACSRITYTFTVYGTSGSTLATTSTYTSCDPELPGGGCVHFTVALGTTGPGTVCVAGDTRIRRHVADHAPDVADASCTTPVPTMSVVEGGSGAQGFH